ncbi:MAG: universal stress protein [Pseudomonadales bacterium]
MKKISSILVILDKAKHPQTALARARLIQQATGAHLHLVAFCWLAMAEEKDIYDAHQRRAMKKAVLHERSTWLMDQVRDAGLAAADVATEVAWTSDIAAWIREHAAERGVDLVLKSIHQSRTLTHTPLDWELLRTCPVPLLLVSTRRRKTRGRVLAALDLRHNDRRHNTLNLRVLDAARCFAELGGVPRAQKGQLHCVSVVEYSTILRDLDFIDVRKKQKAAKQKTEGLLDALLEPYAVPKARVHMPAGKVGQCVAATARKIDADLLVVGTSTRRALGEVLLGSAAEKILTRAPCDVLAVHP